LPLTAPDLIIVAHRHRVAFPAININDPLPRAGFLVLAPGAATSVELHHLIAATMILVYPPLSVIRIAETKHKTLANGKITRFLS
jgi:hypothetical protein